jgi:hypothetical protein
VTKKYQSDRSRRRSRDTPPEYNTVGGITRQAADLKGGDLRYQLLAGIIGDLACAASPVLATAFI